MHSSELTCIVQSTPQNVHWLMGRGLSQRLHVSIRRGKNDFLITTMSICRISAGVEELCGGMKDSQIRVHPKMSTGLWDGAFHGICMYRSDGERMTSSLLSWHSSMSYGPPWWKESAQAVNNEVMHNEWYMDQSYPRMSTGLWDGAFRRVCISDARWYPSCCTFGWEEKAQFPGWKWAAGWAKMKYTEKEYTIKHSCRISWPIKGQTVTSKEQPP